MVQAARNGAACDEETGAALHWIDVRSIRSSMQDHWQDAPVVREDGVSGKIVTATSSAGGSTLLVIQFDDGSRLAIAPSMLAAQPNGGYRLLLAASRLNLEDELVIPVVAEELAVSRRQVAQGVVRIHKRVETHEATLDAATASEEVAVERVPINTLVEGPSPQIREEDGVLIVPVLEEVLVVEKRLMLREEVRVTKHKTTSNTPQTVTLRRETVEIERLAPEDSAPTDPFLPQADSLEIGSWNTGNPQTEQPNV